MMRTIRKLLGREKFEMPEEPAEFGLLRPVLESYLHGGWSMGKTPENPAIVVQFDHKTISSDTHSLVPCLKEIAESHGFEVEIRFVDQLENPREYENTSHSNMTYTDHVGTNPELTQKDYDEMIRKEKKVN